MIVQLAICNQDPYYLSKAAQLLDLNKRMKYFYHSLKILQTVYSNKKSLIFY